MSRLVLTLLIAIAAVTGCLWGVRSARADADPFNSYRWNRDNALARNGKEDRGDWYEWWYYKAVLPETHEAILFTYGVINPWDTDAKRAGSGAVLTFGMLDSGLMIQEKLPVADFEARYDSTFVRVGENIATDRHITGNIRDRADRTVSWDITLEKDWSFKAMDWVMGWTWVSNIFWYPAQASAWMTGWIQVDSRMIHLDHVPAYQDRNWGRSFPKWWTWLVSNQFEGSPGTVLAAGGGRPSFLGELPIFDAFTIGLRHRGQEYAFRITSGDPIHADVHFGKWQMEASNHRGERIVISAFAPKDDFLDLPFLTPTGETFHDYEALLGKMNVQLYKNDELIADLFTTEAGIEYGCPHPEHFHQLYETHTKLLH